MKPMIIALISFAIIMAIIVIGICSKKYKESFVSTGGREAVITPSNAIHGASLMTDSILNGSYSNLTNQINKTGFGTDGPRAMGVTTGAGFDEAYKNQLNINRIQDKTGSASGGFQNIADVTEISRNINSTSGNNAKYNLFGRTNQGGVKIRVEPGGVAGVLAENAYPYRDRPKVLRSGLSEIIEIPAYPIDIGRLTSGDDVGISVGGVKQSAIHRGKSRTPTALGNMSSAVSRSVEKYSDGYILKHKDQKMMISGDGNDSMKRQVLTNVSFDRST
jgi:hypothetical protein